MNLPEGNQGLGRRQGLPPMYSNILGKQVRLATASGKNVLALPYEALSKDKHGGHTTGSIAISVNPITKLPHLYNFHMLELYKEALFGELSPHVLVVAYASYRAMMNKCQGQSILVSGESGGKTETTKLIMQCLAFVGGRVAGDDRTVEWQVLEDVEKYKSGHPSQTHYLNQSKVMN